MKLKAVHRNYVINSKSRQETEQRKNNVRGNEGHQHINENTRRRERGKREQVMKQKKNIQKNNC